MAEIRAFLDAHSEWLGAAVARAPEAIALGPGVVAPYLGRPLRIAHAPGTRGARLLDGEASGERVLRIGGPAASVGRRAQVWLREAARAELSARSAVHARALGVSYSRISVKDTRSRWGSCSSAGALAYSWRLVLAPWDVLDYVAAHEVAHLREMNHSARFWALVERLRPDWRTQRDWLRAHGGELHRYVVEASDAGARRLSA